MLSDEFVKFLGSNIYNEFNEIIGTVVGYVCNGVGEVTNVIVNSGGEVYNFNLERLIIKDNNLYLVSQLAFEYFKIEKNIKKVLLRINNLTKLEITEDINKEIFEKIKLEAEKVYNSLIEDLNKLKSKIQEKINILLEQEKLLDHTILELKINYISKNIDNDNYNLKLRIIQNSKQRINNEISYLNNLLKNISEFDKGIILNIQVLSNV